MPASAPPAVAAAAPSPAVAAPPPDYSMAPEAFVREVASADLFEIRLGELGQKFAQAPEVKAYAKRMAVNHTAIQAIIARLAATESITLPATMTAEDAAVVADLAGRTGTAFDKAYMVVMVARHPVTLERFRWQYDHGESDAVKAFAMQTMPIIGVHARVGDALNAEVNKEEIAAAEAARKAAIAAAEAARLEAAMAAAQAEADAQAKASARRGSRKSRAPKPVQVVVPPPEAAAAAGQAP